MKFRHFLAVTLLATVASTASLRAQLLVTEINSNGSGGDFWELTNVGTSSIDISGYKWNDSQRSFTGTTVVTIPANTLINAGESIIFNEVGTAAVFRAAWGLAATVKVIPGGPGLAMNDGITLYNASGTELFFLTYAAGGFTRTGETASAGGHAGVSAGGAATVSMVWDQASASSPRYSAAIVGSLGSFANPAAATTIGSPGSSGIMAPLPSVTLSVSATPTTFAENATNPASIGTVSRAVATASALVVNLASSDVSEANFPTQVTIPANETSVNFNISAVNDSFPDGTQSVTITASAADSTTALANLSVTDDGDVVTSNLMLTEILSNQASPNSAGAVGDYWELTNFGTTAVDLAGYSWHDSGRSGTAAAGYALPVGSSIAAGESVIFTVVSPTIFRAWWNLAPSVKVFQTIGAPGLGSGDGVSFFDNTGNQMFFFSYAANGFTRADGSPSTTGQAGPSAGGTVDTTALIWVPTTSTTVTTGTAGPQAPRYTFATGSNFGSRQAATALDIGSPGIVDGAPAVSIANASIAEGNTGTTTLALNVTRTDTTSAFTVDYAVTGGTATSGTDYAVLANGTLTFTAASVASQPINISVNGDAATEADETVIITLSNLVNSTGTTIINTATGTGTILNDDVVIPAVTAQPMSTTIATGYTATLSLVVTGLPAPTIQWYQGTVGDTSTPVGTNSSSFTTPVLSTTTDYWARVTNSGGGVNSVAATVTVTPGVTSVNLANYVRVARYDLPEYRRTALPSGTPLSNLLCDEASGVTYNWDTDTLFLCGDGGRAITQVTKTGQLVNTMTLDLQTGAPQGTAFYDPEGITYIGGGQFVFSEERDRQLVRFTYAAGTTLTRAAAQTVDLGTFDDNTGTEGMSWDPQTGGYIVLKEKNPIGVFQTGIDWTAGTATNGSPTTVNSTNLFDTTLLGMTDVADVFAFSNIPSMTGQPQAGNLLIVGQENARILNVDRSGNILSTLNIASDVGNPLSAPDQQHEGITMDRAGNIYVVNENGGGSIQFPQLWVYAPSTLPNAAPTAVALNNGVNSLQENTSTASPIKVGDIVVTDDGLGTNTLILTGADAASFEITGSSLFLKSGITLDFETKTSYAVTINADDTTIGATPDATVNYTLTVTDQLLETPPAPALIITEVAPWSSGSSTVGGDWFEVTNVSYNTVNITGWKIDDNSNSFAASLTLNGITTIAPGESVIFIESTVANQATIVGTFRSVWFGANPPAGLQIGTYTGSGIGLGTGGDAVNLFNAGGTLQANVTFGISPSAAPFTTFDNTLARNNTAITTFAAVGVNGAFAAPSPANEVGSPGVALPGVLRVTEVAPWSSGSSPVMADWFEVTNTGSRAVDLTGWKVDDSSESPAAALPLTGITSIAPGESVIFVETATLATTRTAFLANWFGANPPATLQVGGYSGSGIGLSTGGDAVNLFDPNNVRAANLAFGIAPSAAPFATFDNAALVNVGSVTVFSTAGVNGAFVATNSSIEIGSPGTRSSAPIGASTVSIASAVVSEGNSGNTVLNLPVTRTNTASVFTVAYAVTSGTATSGSDFTLASGTLSFAFNGAATQNIAISVVGDTVGEGDETVTVTLSNIVNANGTTTLGTVAGTGTITNDDGPIISTPLSNTNSDVTLANTETWPAAGINVGGTQFINLGLQGVGRVPASSIDPATGETLGSVSDMQISNWVKNANGTFSGTLSTLPDRGYNSGTIFSNYAARINDFSLTFTPYTGSTATTAQNQIALSFAGSTRFTYDHDANPATAPVFTTGLLADGGIPLFGTTVPVKMGASTQSDGTVTNRLTVDSEGLILDKRPGKAGSGWVSDEYGPYIYHFNSSKQIDGQLQLPAALLPRASGTLSFNATPANNEGRRINQGMEGLAQNPAGTKLFGLMQSATMQDSSTAQQTRLNTRLVVYDISSSDTPSAPSAQYVIQLPRLDSTGSTTNGTTVDRTAAQSSILALNDRQLLILSRDGNGRGAAGSPVFKSILLADLTGATNINGLFDAAGSAVAPAGVLNASVTPLTWTEALNLIGKLDQTSAEVAKFGLNLNAAPGDINSISEKWEALSLVSASDPANPNDYFLFVGNDNDFITQTGVYKDATGALQNYNAGIENDTVILAYRIRMAGPDNQAPFATVALLPQSTAKGAALSYTLPANAFVDPEGQTLSLSASRANDSALPAWLTFNATTRTFSGSPTAADYGTLVVKVTATDNGSPALSYSTNFTVQVTPPAVGFTLQVLHLADAEAGLLASSTAPNLAALVDAFDGAYPNTLILAGGDNYIPGPFAAAGTDALVSATHNKGNNPFAADIEIHNRIGVEASTVGNHEFDFGTNAFSDAIADTNFPYLSSNLNFAGDSGISARYQETVATGGLEEASSVKNKIVPSAVVTKGTEKIGLVGVTTQIVEGISSTGNVEVKGFAGDGLETNNMVLLASQVQPVIDDLRSQGVNKIVLMAHLQQITFEQQLAPLLTGVDIILAAGSNTRLGDSNDVPVAFTGHAADFAGNYPIYTAGADGLPTVIINTDNEFTYLGRLVADFDADGDLIVPNLTANTALNGAYAATSSNVATAWGTTEANLASTAFATGTKGALVKQITDAVQGVISVKDGAVRGFTNVYLEGERNFVRNQQTNLGDISADSMIFVGKNALPSATHIAALKNGGGIRAAIGAVEVGNGNKIPPLANPSAGKPAGAISLLDIENSMRFNNGLMLCDTTPAGLKVILEHGVASLGNQGRFPQIGGIRFSYTPAAAAGSRIQSIVLVDQNDIVTARVVSGGAVVSGAPATITLVTLNFLANGGDSYPFKANADNFRYLLNDGTLSGVIDEASNFTAAGVVPANILGEQLALSNHLQNRYATANTAYSIAETVPALDTRIQSTAVRTDTVPNGLTTLTLWLADNGLINGNLDTDFDGLTDLQEFAFGLNRSAADNAALNVNIPAGPLNARGVPTIYSAPTHAGQDFRFVFVRVRNAASVGITYTPQFSNDMGAWENRADLPATVIATSGDYEAVSVKYPFFTSGKKARFARMAISTTP